MNKPQSILILFLISVSIIGGGCARKLPGDDRILAVVGNRTVTLGEFNAKISRLPSYYKNVVEKNREKYLDEMIAEMLFYEEAVRAGLEHDKEVRDVIEEAKKRIMIAKLVKNDVDDKVTVKEDEIKVFYESHKDELKTPPMWRASHILVSNEREAVDVMDALAKGARFEDLAKTHSIDATASRGGDIGYFREGQLVPEFEKACVALDVGQVSGIVSTKFGYHIIKLTDKKDSGTESYEKARKAIENELKKRKRSELFDRLISNLKKKYAVQVKEDALKALDSAENKKETTPAAK